jgi:hypothetical protein
MKFTWGLGIIPVVLAFAAPGCSGGGGGGGIPCSDAGTCDNGLVCGPQGVCVPAGTGGSSGSTGGSAGSGFGGSSGSTGGSAGSGFGGSSGSTGGSAGSGFGGSAGSGFGGSAGSGNGGVGGNGGAGGNGGVGGSGNFDCAGYCQKWDSANCPNDPSLSECISTCQSETGSVASQCGSQANTWLECVKNTATITCDPTEGISVTSDCSTQNQSYIACAVCLFPSTDPCANCNKSSCCSQMQGFWSDANANAFLACANPCTTQACFDQCVSQYPSTGPKYAAWAQCQTSSCGSQCG